MPLPQTAPVAHRSDDPSDLDVRFRTLVQSPLRAGLLRFLSARPQEAFEVEALMSTFGRMRLDVDNCLKELVEFGVVCRVAGPPDRYAASRPGDERAAALLDTFLERRAQISTEDQSPSVQRFREMIGRDEKMLIVFEWIRTAAKSDISVLILGPTGSGKEVVARMIHELSRRGSEKFQAVNCAALPDTLFESEIFGYEKGAFTGAHDRKPGRLELANEGTLFLDEIANMPIRLQAKLLRVLQTGEVQRVGSSRLRYVNARIISATNADLESEIAAGRFREDLLYRLNTVVIHLPPLRDRREDVAALAAHFLAHYAARYRKPLSGFDEAALSVLRAHSWPGNVRELAHAVERAVLMAESSATSVGVRDLGLQPQRAAAEPSTPRSLEDAERRFIEKVLADHGGDVRQAAQQLGMSRSALYRRLQQYGVRE